MPTYVYAYLDARGEPTGEMFEVVQSMKEAAWDRHPENGRKVKRVPQTVNIAGKWSDMKGKGALSNSNLERLGFTKYERKGKGYMERTAGKAGPRSISAED